MTSVSIMTRTQTKVANYTLFALISIKKLKS
jgi:hypothetical protein